MAYSVSTKKRIRQSRAKNLYNRQYKSKMKTSIRRVNESENKEEALKLFNEAVSIIDKVAQKGIIHKNAAAHKKSRLAKRVNAL
ncbi:MAG: 30S ribosomal protein S20 [Candidatus Neomarinimicrobiota bacterium]